MYRQNLSHIATYLLGKMHGFFTLGGFCDIFDDEDKKTPAHVSKMVL